MPIHKEVVTLKFYKAHVGYGFGKTESGAEVYVRVEQRVGNFELHAGLKLVGEIVRSHGKRPRLCRFELAPDQSERYPDSPQDRDRLLTQQCYTELLAPLASRRAQ